MQSTGVISQFSLTEPYNSDGWTPLASAAFHNNETLCEFLVERGFSLCLDTEQKKQLKPELSRRIHVAGKSGHKTTLGLLLDMGADINERNQVGETALLVAVFHKPSAICTNAYRKRSGSYNFNNE